MNSEMEEPIIDWLQVQSNGRVLEVGSGPDGAHYLMASKSDREISAPLPILC